MKRIRRGWIKIAYSRMGMSRREIADFLGVSLVHVNVCTRELCGYKRRKRKKKKTSTIKTRPRADDFPFIFDEYEYAVIRASKLLVPDPTPSGDMIRDRQLSKEAGVRRLARVLVDLPDEEEGYDIGIQLDGDRVVESSVDYFDPDYGIMPRDLILYPKPKRSCFKRLTCKVCGHDVWYKSTSRRFYCGRRCRDASRRNQRARRRIRSDVRALHRIGKRGRLNRND